MALLLDTNGKDRIIADGYILENLKNQIINGNFQVNQRAVSGTVVLTAGQYGHDRFKAGASGCTYTFATVENVTTITITAGSLIQVIEGFNLETGTYVLSWNGTAQGKIGAGSYGNSGITGSVVGGTNLNIEFGTGTLSKVRFNKGSVPVEWQTEAYADVLDKCQDYYETGLIPAPLGYYTGSLFVFNTLSFKKRKRVNPTLTITAESGAYMVVAGNYTVEAVNNAGWGSNGATQHAFSFIKSKQGTGNATPTVASVYNWQGNVIYTADCEL